MWFNIKTNEFSDSQKEDFDYVNETPMPITTRLEKVILDGVEEANGQLQTKWKIIPLTADEVTQLEASERATLIASIIALTQQRLDDFAKTRNYDSMLSACTYATSSSTKFSTDGKRCVDLRDATWAALYSIFDAVEKGERTISSYSDIAGELPSLEW